MIRWLFAIVGGVLLVGVVHLVSVLVLPRVATLDAYSRLAPITKLNAVTALPAALIALGLGAMAATAAFAGWLEHGTAIFLSLADSGMAWCF